jgi:two-component system phosphate regulon response regulator PhoB
MNQRTVLVVEDESAVRQLLKDFLGQQEYKLYEALDSSQAWQALQVYKIHLVLLDWMLPDISGVEFLKALRRDKNFEALPVIMLTARGEEQDRVRGLEAGADDYLVKPFSLRELQARVSAVLRRSSMDIAPPILPQGIEVDHAAHRVIANGVALKMGPTEFRLLTFLMDHPERVFSRTQLLDRVWGSNIVVEERTVDVHVRRLRKALEVQKLDYLIQTVRGTGYRFSQQP